MSNCIKTGAVVHLNEYNCSVIGDIHEVEGVCLILNFNAESMYYKHDRPTTHCLTIGDGYVNKAKGIIVVKPGSISLELE